MKIASLLTWLLTLFLCLSVSFLFGQQTLTGVVEDENGDPLIGATVMIKGTDRGTITDMEGKYAIQCSPGETLVITYIGYPTTETVLTERSFRGRGNKNKIQQKQVKAITSNAYQLAIQNDRDTAQIKASSKEKFLLNSRIYNYRKIKDIKFGDPDVRFDFADDPWKYQIGLSQKLAFSFIPDQRLPALQTEYAAGTNDAGVINLLDAMAEFPQAFGPNFNQVRYDDIPTMTNPAGQLIFAVGADEPVGRDPRPDIFPGVLLSTTGLNLQLSRKKEKVFLRLKHQSGKDVFGVRPFSINRMSIDFIKKINNSKLTVKGALQGNKNNQSNRNGLANGIYQFAYQSPTEFPLNYTLNRDQNRTATNGPFDNPFYLLENALDQNTMTRWNLGAKWNQNAYYTRDFNFSVQTDISGSRQKVNFLPGQNQIGMLNPILQDYQLPVWQNQCNIDYKFEDNFNAEFIARHSLENLTYEYAQGVMEESALKLKRNNLDFLTRFNYDTYKNEFLEKVHVYNQIFISSYDQQKFFLPGFSIKFNGEEWLKKKKIIDEVYLSGEFSRSIYQQPLLYQNRSWNYVGLDAFDQANYMVLPELATPENLNLETRNNFIGNLRIGAFNDLLSLHTNYYHTLRKDVVGHRGILADTKIENLATLREQGLEINLEFNKNRYWNHHHNFKAQFIFELNRSKVVALNDGVEKVILGGTANVQQLLKTGASSGAFQGTTWLRNENGDLLIDESGYPMVNHQLSIIGDALPDYRLKLNLVYSHQQYSAGVSLMYSKGGQTWNGTQASLDFLGLSQNSAELRTTENYIFPGVNMDGRSNTIPVSFGESNGTEHLNRWQRYGPGGVGEAYVEDASFLTFSTFYFGYKFIENENLFRELSLKVYANNLMAWLPFSGFSPFRSFRDLDATSAIQLFNLPMSSEIGLTLIVKI